MHWKSTREKLLNWELWPFALRYLFIMPVWVWYCLRSGSWWFFSASNPTITFGGFEGEGKKEMYALLPGETYPKTIFIEPGAPWETVIDSVHRHGFQFPFVVKPDVGMKGLLFRKIDGAAELRRYHEAIPMEYIIQELVTYPLEVSVFYYRYPQEERGVITGFIQKDLMEVWGDGMHTLWDLIMAHPKARYRGDEMRLKHGASLDKVLPQGERYVLTWAANLNRGASFSSLYEQADEALLQLFDRLSKPTQFYYGRYDIKCTSVEDLKGGRNFSILEFNGAGAEPNHVYHAGLSLWAAQKEILRHWKVLFEISRYNHRRGIRYWPFAKGWKFLRSAKRHLKILEKYEREIPA